MADNDEEQINIMKRRALALMQDNRLDEARELYSSAVTVNPEDIDAWYMLSGINGKLGLIDDAESCCRHVLALQADHSDTYVNLGHIYARRENYHKALDHYQTAARLQQDSSVAFFNMGIMFNALNKRDEAIESYRKAIDLSPMYFEAHNNLGVMYLEQGDYNGAASCYVKALEANPLSVKALDNLDNIYFRRGNYHEALDHYQTAVQLKPDFPIAYFKMGIIFNALNKRDEAIESYRKAIDLSPMYSDAHNNLGVMYLEQGDYNGAASCYVKALEANPLSVTALNNLAWTCHSQEHFERYAEFYHQAIAHLPDPTEARHRFIETIGKMPFSTDISWLDEELHKCLSSDVESSPWLASVAARLFKDRHAIQKHKYLDEKSIQSLIERIASEDLDILIIEKVVNGDPELEALFTRVRRTLLYKANKIIDISDKEIRVISALAFQCFNNEYIFTVDEEEEIRLSSLKEAIEQIVSENHHPNKDLECMLFMVGMYENLFLLSCSKRLASYPITAWSDRFSLYAEQSLFNYFAEQEIQETIESIGTISDKTSQLVQTQYENNPYPRWLSVCKNRTEISTKQFIKSQIPNFSPPKFLDGPIKVLIAGCGTGQQAIYAALSYSNAEILAVDISKSSLAYAIRMTDKYGIKNIQFKQADILELSQLDARFHIIECRGVLHHMEDPIKGWRVLNELLVDKGLMSIGLYSEKARKSVVAARKIIENEKLFPSERNIRKFRSRILRHEIPDLSHAFNISYDFYTMSMCRDLLFHFNEHRFTLPQIKTIINNLNMNFLAFRFPDSRVMNRYHKQFPEDNHMTNLLLWDQFENLYPGTFGLMYEFYCQKS